MLANMMNTDRCQYWHYVRILMLISLIWVYTRAHRVLRADSYEDRTKSLTCNKKLIFLYFKSSLVTVNAVTALLSACFWQEILCTKRTAPGLHNMDYRAMHTAKEENGNSYWLS